MNILFITQRCGTDSGWERYSSEVVNASRRGGHQVQVLACAGEPEYYLSLPDPMRFKKLAAVSAWQAFRFWLGHRKLLADCDLLHCAIESYAPFTQVLAKLSGKPYIITAHGSFAVKSFVGLFGILQRQAFTHARTIACVSHYTKDRLHEILPLQNLSVIPNGVDAANFTPTPLSGKDRALILGVGAIKPRKGFHLVLEALPQVLQKVPSVQYLMVGTVENKTYVAALKRRIQELGLEQHAKLVGTVSEETLRTLYKKAAVFALTPISTATDFEGFGLVYLEANACGIPTVGMKGSGAEDAIRHGKTGLLAGQEDSADTAKQLITLLTDDRAWIRMSEGGKTWAAAHAWDSIVQKLYGIE